MNLIKKHYKIFFFCSLLILVLILACGKSNNPVSPGNTAKISIQLEFPEELSGSLNKTNSPNKTVDIKAIDQVTVSVLNSNTYQAVIVEQPLEIVTTAEGRFAQGEVNIPVSEEFQSFRIIVFASDIQQLLFLMGTGNITLQQDQTEVQEVVIEMGLAPSIASAVGFVTASSTASGDFGPERGVDLDFGTSWLSAGENSSTFIWSSPQRQLLGTVGVFNNSEHDNPQYRTGFGFETIKFQVFDEVAGEGELLFEETVPYPKTAEVPIVRVSPMTLGRSIKLTLTGPENSERGGFAELLIVNPLLSPINIPELQSIDVSPENLTIHLGSQIQYAAFGNMSNGTRNDITSQVTWNSSNPNVATISSNGLAQALSAGTSVISANMTEITGQTNLTVAQLNAATLSGLQSTLRQVNDSTNCDIFGGAVGNLYQLDFDYNDVDGDVTDGTVVNVSFQFLPAGNTGNFDVTRPSISGDGSSGSISILACFIFSDQASVDVTVRITDNGGSQSDGVTINIPKPENGNTILRDQFVESAAAHCSN